MTQAWPLTIAAWLSLLGVVVSASWALTVFNRRNAIKAAEILIALEERYSSIQPFLLQLEESSWYEGNCEQLLKDVLDDKKPKKEWTDKERKTIENIESVMRHYLMCSHIRTLKVDKGILDALHSYYLRKFLDEEAYALLNNYIKKFWPRVYTWGSTVYPHPLAKV